MFNLAQIFTVDLNNQDKLFKIKFKIQFQNFIQDSDKVESNSSSLLQAADQPICILSGQGMVNTSENK